MKKSINILLLVFTVFLFFSCKKETLLRDSSAKLDFSTDTIMYDTVFTDIGSTTRQFKVYNPYSQPVLVSSIFLARGQNSPFRLNIDGESAIKVTDIEIPAHDSMYIFVEVTVDPNNQNSPMVITDSVIFQMNGNSQDVKLVAWGQDVHLINGEIICTQTWSNDKPYLVYNSMLVDSSCVLTIEQGTKIHFHHGSRMYVKGTLIVNGTLENPVVFQGDRLEQDYKDIPGQWDGLYFVSGRILGSRDNVLNFAEIRNAIIGVQADTFMNANPNVTLLNCKIFNMNAAGIYAQGSSVFAANSVIANCGQYAVALVYGGKYEFYQCTIDNRWGWSNRTTPALYINNYYQDVYGVWQVRPLEKADFANCIIYGNKDSEVELDPFPTAGTFNYKFDHSLLKIDPAFNTSDPAFFNEIEKNSNPKFRDPGENDFYPDTLSSAWNKGDQGLLNSIIARFPMYQLDQDIDGTVRSFYGLPDMGAYERKE